MQIGFVGLGKMGGNMVHRIHRDSDHQVVAFDLNDEHVREAEEHGAKGVASLDELVSSLEAPRHGVDHGPGRRADPVDHRRARRHARRRATRSSTAATRSGTTTSSARPTLTEQGIRYVDVGTSGGVWGLEVGYCMMVGGHPESVEQLAPILDVLAPPDGWRHFGDAGAGHFVKMIHNGIEYGIMQAYAEGFEVMHKSRFPIELEEVCGLWNRGSVVRSWLLELAEKAFQEEGNDLENLGGNVSDSGEGRWTLADAIDLDVPTPVIAAALYARFYSRKEGEYTHKVLAALRNQFGGHAVERAAGAGF